MLQIIGIGAGIALVVALVTGMVAIGWTLLSMLAGGGIVLFFVVMAIPRAWQSHQREEEARRERDHQRMLEAIDRARGLGADVEILPPRRKPPLTLPRVVQR